MLKIVAIVVIVAIEAIVAIEIIVVIEAIGLHKERGEVIASPLSSLW